MRPAPRTDLRINLAERVLGWVVPAFIGAAVLVALAIAFSQVAAALTHFLEALP